MADFWIANWAGMAGCWTIVVLIGINPLARDGHFQEIHDGSVVRAEGCKGTCCCVGGEAIDRPFLNSRWAGLRWERREEGHGRGHNSTVFFVEQFYRRFCWSRVRAHWATPLSSVLTARKLPPVQTRRKVRHDQTKFVDHVSRGVHQRFLQEITTSVVVCFEREVGL